MVEYQTINGLELSIVRVGSPRVCCILLPRGLMGDGADFLEKAAARYQVSIVVVSGMNWNDDLTPWAADPVFKREKPFGGNAAAFLRILEDDIMPEVERTLGFVHSGSMSHEDQSPIKRYLVGISLSGLFALWAAHCSDSFAGIASISGSFWFPHLEKWVQSNQLSNAVHKVYISLGDREKDTRNNAMTSVETNTVGIVSHLRKTAVDVEYRLEEGTTHFSPIVPRLDAALDSLLGPTGSL
ncbi:MAG: hypothetical protein MJY97_04650 [Bacteroidales bacterium]|nr:hypothetical protein [Bacteroidales bacterium]